MKLLLGYVWSIGSVDLVRMLCLGFHHEKFQLHFHYLATYFLQIHSFRTQNSQMSLVRKLVLLFKLKHVEKFYSSLEMKDFDSL